MNHFAIDIIEIRICVQNYIKRNYSRVNFEIQYFTPSRLPIIRSNPDLF